MEAKRAPVTVAGSGGSEVLAKARSLATSTWALGGLVFVVTWGGGLAPAFTPNVDVSFHAGLSMAATDGLRFGSDVVVTYGPLGFLKSYFAFEEWPARLAIAYGLALHLALSVSLVWALRRNYPTVVAALLALVVAAILRGDLSAIAIREDGAVVALAMIWAIAAIALGAPRFVRPLVVYGGGAFAAIELLAKLNTGLVVLALVAIAVIAMEGQRWRNLAALGATLVGSLAILWFATGHGVGDVGPYVSGSLDLVSGYSSAARTEFSWEDRSYDYLLAPIILAGAVAIAWVSGLGAPALRRAAMLLALAVAAFSAYKAGFVAHETWHMATFFGTMLGAYVAFPLPRGHLARAAALAATIALAATTLLSVGFSGYPLTDPAENVRNAGATVAAAADGGELRDEIDENRNRLIEQFALDAESRELVTGRGVHVDPSETAAAWAYGLDWEPLPVFQPYAAWTTELDEQNADALASAGGPERILRQQIEGYGRYPGFESPAAMVAMLCNFEALSTTDAWQVLARVPDRCGVPRPLDTAEGSYGEPIPVPPAPPGAAVLARVEGVQVAGTERLRTLAARARERTIRFGGGPFGGPDAREWALVEGTADDGLLLVAPSELDFPAQFALAPNPETITFLLDGEAADGEITVEFLALPVDPSRGRPEA